MLTDMNLDNENFEDLVEEAKNMIVSYYPEWTDFNYHDPGITISELFAFLKEAAQYRMNYIGDAHKMKYLKLMGVERRMRSQAKARLTVKSKENVWLPALTRFYASGICFENPEPKYIAAGDLSGCIFPAENGQVHLGSMQPGAKITPFGRKPKTDACFYIYFKERLPADIPLSVYVQAYDGYPVVRNELKESYDFYALAEMDMEYMSENGWQQCSVFEDGTKGFQQSGWLKFTLGGSHGFTEFGGGAGYFLRFRLKKADYDIPPVLVRIGMNVVDVCQTRHYVLSQDAECEQQEGRAVCRIEANEVTTGNLSVLEKVGEGYRIIENYSAEKKGHWIELSFPCDEQGHLPEQIRIIAWELMYDLSLMTEEGNGLPFQEICLDDNNTDIRRIQVMVEDEKQSGIFREWERRPDFEGSQPSDCHYVMDAAGKKIIFGDCLRGRAPEGQIFITQHVSCEGAQGNVKAGAIAKMEEGYEGLSVTNEKNASGGSFTEDLKDCFMRARAAVYDNGALLTDEDYENAVRRTPGLMIENCRVIHEASPDSRFPDNRIVIAVKPFSFEKNPALSKSYIRNILAWLDSRRMIGTDIRLISPEYLRLNVFVECRGRNNYIFDREVITGALNQYFQPFSSRFGMTVSQSGLYEMLDCLDSVEMMEGLSIDVAGSGAGRTLGGDIILPQNGLISPKDIQYNININ